MAWSGLTNNQFVSYNDAKTSGISTIATLPTSNGWMTKTNATTYLQLDSNKLSGYTSNQYVTKLALINAEQIVLTDTYITFLNSANGTIIQSNSTLYVEQMPITFDSAFSSGTMSIIFLFNGYVDFDATLSVYSVIDDSNITLLDTTGNMSGGYNSPPLQVNIPYGSSLSIRVQIVSMSSLSSTLTVTIDSATLTTGQNVIPYNNTDYTINKYN